MKLFSIFARLGSKLLSIIATAVAFRTKTTFVIAAATAMLLVGACVSVKMPVSSGARAKDVQFAAPGKPFTEIDAAGTDRAWISEKSGNTISFLSNCSTSADPTLQQLETESLAGLNAVKVVETKDFDYNGRNARKTLVEGEVDGVAVKTELLIFKKNGCSFTLSYGGVQKNFDSDRAQFQKFTQSFHAQ